MRNRKGKLMFPPEVVNNNGAMGGVTLRTVDFLWSQSSFTRHAGAAVRQPT